jgi:hypothetical protein
MTSVTPPTTRTYQLGPVKPWVQNAAYILGPMFGIQNIGGVRADPLPDHPSGHALDFMISSQQQGDELASYAVAHSQQLGIKYIIWNKRYWDPQQGWGPYTNPPQIAYNPHTDHVHITFLDQPGAWTGGTVLASSGGSGAGGSTGNPGYQLIPGGQFQLEPGAADTCAWNLNFPHLGSTCIISKKALRQITGSFLLIGGGIVFLVGLSLIVVYGLGQSKESVPILGKILGSRPVSRATSATASGVEGAVPGEIVE